MRYFLRRAAVFSAAVTLIFFCSCERHKPDELHHAGHGAADSGGHGEKASHETKPAEKAHATPAEFFPSPSPSGH